MAKENPFLEQEYPAASFNETRALLAQYGQSHALQHVSSLTEKQKHLFVAQLANVDFPLLSRLINDWILGSHEAEAFENMEPVNTIPYAASKAVGNEDAWEAGEEAIAAGRVGLVLVAGGQGTRLGFDGPKGAFPIGPVSGCSIFAFHADKIHNLQRRYDCVFPWYIIVGATNGDATRAFFRKHRFFGLDERNILFFQQDMVPCVDSGGKVLLEDAGRLAMNPNGHGGCLPAMARHKILEDARGRGVDTLSYFQVDNWAVRVADPYFIGHHLLREGHISSKFHRKESPRESAGVFCRCDGKDRIIEYTELDIYPRLLDTDSGGSLLYFAANAAIHVLSVDFVEQVSARFDAFPWHCSHKKIPHLAPDGAWVDPPEPNGYKFETFIFDALQFCTKPQVVLEIAPKGEFAPTKQMTGPGSVEEGQRQMSAYWSDWLEAAGCNVASLANPDGPAQIEISPGFALTKEEFVAKTRGHRWPGTLPIGIGPEGEVL